MLKTRGSWIYPFLLAQVLLALVSGCVPGALAQVQASPQATTTRILLPVHTETVAPSPAPPTEKPTPLPTIPLTSTPQPSMPSPTVTAFPSPEPLALPNVEGLPHLSLTSAERIKRIGRLPRATVGDYAISRDGRWLAIASGPVLRIFDFVSGHELDLLSAADGRPAQFTAGLAFHPNGLRLVAVDRPNHLRAWTLTIEAGQMQPAQVFRYEDPGLNSLTQLVYTPDGSRLLGLGTQAGQAEIVIWDAASGQILQRTPAGSESDPLLVSQNSYLALQASLEGTLRFWDPASGRALGQQIMYACPDSLVGAAFAPDGQLLAIQCDGELSRIFLEQPDYFQPDNLTLIRTLDTGAPGPGLLAFNRDGGLLVAASGSPANQLVLWNLIQKSPIRLFFFASPIRRLSISPDGRLLLLLFEDGTLEIWGAPA